MVLTGDIGKLRVGYHEVAKLAKWRLTRREDVLNAESSELTAVVTARDAFWISQSNVVDVELWMGTTWWKWKGATISDISGRTTELQVPGNPVAHN